MQYAAVTQKDEWGCGVACVASLLDIAYDDAKVRLESSKGATLNQRPKGLELDAIVHVLHDAGISVVANWYAAKYPVGTIALVFGAGNYADGHYLLRVPNGWMNPWETLYDRRRKRTSSIKKTLPRGTRVDVALVPVDS